MHAPVRDDGASTVVFNPDTALAYQVEDQVATLLTAAPEQLLDETLGNPWAESSRDEE